MGLAYGRSPRGRLRTAARVAVEPEVIDLFAIRRPQITRKRTVVEVQIIIGDAHDIVACGAALVNFFVSEIDVTCLRVDIPSEVTLKFLFSRLRIVVILRSRAGNSRRIILLKFPTCK